MSLGAEVEQHDHKHSGNDDGGSNTRRHWQMKRHRERENE